ncbi:MAG: hypothetical protein M3R41_11445, partial [Pseudomonadota bacterium]|nr:hypothetical protein [Pseudomonadota bacterium]
YYNHRQVTDSGAQGEQLLAAYDKMGNPAAAARPLDDLAASRFAGYRAVAKLNQANLLLQKNDLKGAAAKFGEVAGDSSVAEPMRDFALVRQTSIEFDSLKPQTIVDRLRPLSAKGNPWFGSAGEMVAAAYLQMNRRDLAATLYGQIAADDNAPASIRQRAGQMAAMLSVGAAAPSPEKKAS